MKTTIKPQSEDDLPEEVDFSGATRGKFFRPDLTLIFPDVLDVDDQIILVKPYANLQSPH